MARVLLSYSVADEPRAVEVRRMLVAEGHEVFLDHDPRAGIKPGQEWEAGLHAQLRRADVTTGDKPRRLATLAGHPSPEVSPAWSPDSRTLATAGGSEVLLWDLTDRENPSAQPASSDTPAACC